MNENIKIMLEKLAKDEEAQRKLAAVRDPDEAYAIVTAIHGGYTKEEFIEAAKAIQEQQSVDLSDEELAKTSGGSLTLLVTTLTAALSYAIVTAAKA